MSESQRHLARVLVLKALYAADHSEDEYQTAFDKILSEEDKSTINEGFASDLYLAVINNREWADDQITILAENWKLERIAAIDRTILQIGLVELKEMVDVPFKVVINEAIELAKEFSTKESSRFINGILDNFVKKTILTSDDK